MWHSTVAVDLAPGLTEVTVFAGCPQFDPEKALTDQVKVAETVILSFGMLSIGNSKIDTSLHVLAISHYLIPVIPTWKTF